MGILNSPINREWTAEEIVKEYQIYKDKKYISKIFQISVKELNGMLKKAGVS